MRLVLRTVIVVTLCYTCACRRTLVEDEEQPCTSVSRAGNRSKDGDADAARAEDVVASPVTSPEAERLVDDVTARLRLTLKVKEGDPSFRSDLARQVAAFKNEHSQLMFMDATQASVDQFLPPALHALSRIGTAHKHLLVAVQNELAFIACRAVHHACYLDDWATSQFKFSHDLSLDENAGVSNLGTPIVKMISWRRLEIVRDILAMGVNVLAVDADIAYFRDPLQFVHANIGSYDLLHSSRDGTGVEANLGFYYVKATPGGKALLNATLASHIKQPKLWDQQAFNDVRKQTCKFTHIPASKGQTLCQWVRGGPLEAKYRDDLGQVLLVLDKTKTALESDAEVVFIHLCCVPDSHTFKATVTFAAQQQLYNYPELLIRSA